MSFLSMVKTQKFKTLEMSSSLAIRHARHLSTTAAATTDAASSTLSISKAKAKLRTEYDPDKVLQIYSSASGHYTSPLSSRYVQKITVTRLAKSRRFSEIETLIESHKNDPNITQEPFLSTLIRSYGLAGMFDHSLKTYNQMDELGTPRTTISFNALLSACNHSKLFDQVPRLFEEMPQKFGFLPDKISYGILVKSYCDSGSPELAISKLKEMEEKGIEISTITFTTILHALYKQGKSDEAERIWNEMVNKGCSPDVAAYNVRIMHAHGGEPETVKRLIDEISNVGLKPDTITYNYLMTCYCKSGMLDEAKNVYEGLERYGCHPNAATFRTLIHYLCMNEKYEKGYKVFKESVMFDKFPDFNALKPLVEGLVKISKMKEAKGLIRTMKKKFPSNLLNAWIVEDLGLAAADYSSDSGHYTSPPYSRYAQKINVERLAKSGRFSDIETLIESHKNDPKITQEPYLSTLIQSYGLAGMFDHSLKTYNQMDELGTPRTTISFNALLSACNQSKQFDQVPQLFEEMPQKFGFLPDKISYGILVKSYCDLGLPELAISKMKEVEEKGIEITSIMFTRILHALYKQGKSDEAERFWNEMVNKGCLPDVAAFNVRIMHCHGGEPESVKGLIEEISKAGLKPDTISYNYLMTCYCKSGMLEEAKKVYEELEGNGCHPNAATFRTLIHYLCINENYEKGYKVFKESVMFDKFPDFNTLKPLVEGLVKISKLKEAKGLIRTMKKKFPPNLLNSWKRLEDLGLAAAAAGSSVPGGEKKEKTW